MSDHSTAQHIPVIPTGKTIKPITASTFADGDIVVLPSFELVRYQSAPPAPGDKFWHLHPQTENGQGDAVEHKPDGKGWITACLWKYADRHLSFVDDMIQWGPAIAPWHGGLIAPGGQPLALLLDVDHGDGEHTYLCSDCYETGPDGSGYEPSVPPGGHVVITVSEAGWCEICCREYLVECNRLIELPDGTLEKERLANENEALHDAVAEVKTDELGEKFRSVIRARLSVADLAKVDARNASEKYREQNSCATHDFCDANIYMLEAFEAVMGRAADMENDRDGDLINAAWDRAKGAGFAIRVADMAAPASSPAPPPSEQPLAEVVIALFASARRNASQSEILADVAARLPGYDPEGVQVVIDAALRIVHAADSAPEPMTPVVKCPKCGTDDPALIRVKETFTAYHPTHGYKDTGGCGIAADLEFHITNALGEKAPSLYFDEGECDYKAHCNECAHTGSPGSFGMPDPADWKWC